jgi:hypothetical protein
MFIGITRNVTIGEIYMSEENEIVESAPEAELEAAPEMEAESENLEEGSSEETERDEKGKFSPEQQKHLGKLLSEQRKRLKAELAEKGRSGQPFLPNAQVPEGMIFDPEIGQNVDVSSPMGQMALREQLKAQKAARDAQARTEATKQAQYDELAQKLDEGNEKYTNFHAARMQFADAATPEMADALCGLDAPDAVVAYFGDKKGELQRISRLSPARQMREIFRIEETLTPRKKLVTNAPAPVNKIKSTGGNHAPVSRLEMNADQRRDFYEKRFNSR